MPAFGLDHLRKPIARLGARLPAPVRDAARPVARRLHLAAPVGEWWRAARPPWAAPSRAERTARARCNVCRWTGQHFIGIAHVESAVCPRCGSIARDRFLMWCFVERGGASSGARVLETSPRLGADYRAFMGAWFAYRASDYDLSAHVGDIRLDLQDIDLPTASVDVVLTPHVLEHVPDTAKAISELFRIIAPGGRMYLQVPLQRGRTEVPTEPEFHADNTPVFFNFGWDLTDQLRAGGFQTEVLVTSHFHAWLAGDAPVPDAIGDGFSPTSLAEHVRIDDVTSVADDTQSASLGFLPSYHFATWECRRP